MRKSLVAVLAVAILGLFVYRAVSAPTKIFTVDSGLLGVNNGEIVSGWLENTDTLPHTYRIVIFVDGFGGVLTPVSDTGTLTIPAGGIVISTYTNSGGINLFAVEATLDSTLVVPTAIAQVPGCSPVCTPPRIEIHGAQFTTF